MTMILDKITQTAFVRNNIAESMHMWLPEYRNVFEAIVKNNYFTAKITVQYQELDGRIETKNVSIVDCTKKQSYDYRQFVQDLHESWYDFTIHNQWYEV